MSFLLLLGMLGVQDTPIAISADRIHTGTGTVIQKATLVIHQGRIVSIGPKAAIPEGARLLKASVVMPGLVDAGSGLGAGTRANEDGAEITPDVRMVDAFDPEGKDLQRAREEGVTTLYVGPGNRNVIGGLGAVVRTAGEDRRSMILMHESALKAALGSTPSSGNYPPRGSAATFFSRRPTTRMGVIWEFRKAFLEAEQGAIVQAREGKLPVRVAASRASDIEYALDLSKEFGFKLILEEGQEAHRHAPALVKAGVPVLLRPVFSVRSLGGRDGSRTLLDTFARLRKAGVVTALLSPAGQPGALRSAAVFAVRYGARPGDALQAITLTPAKILGVADRTGSLEKGKLADFLVLSGDPLDLRSRVEKVFIQGRELNRSEGR